MPGLERFVQILRLFGEERGEWTIQAICEALDMPTSTVYRIVRELVDHRFLEPAQDAQYRLGSALIEFDRRVRMTDLLIRKGSPFLPDLLRSAGLPGMAVLARLYGDEVICVADAATPGVDLEASFERGRPMQLLRGATAKTILAQLPSRRLSRVLEAAPGSFNAGVEALRAEMSRIRRRGYCVSYGEVDRHLVGIAAPVAHPGRAITASLSLIVRAADMDAEVERRLVLTIVPAAKLLADEIAA